MAQVINLYLDDSGTRNPDRGPRDLLPRHGHDWFALGGVLIRDSDEVAFRSEYSAFYEKWSAVGLAAPLHSSEIRAKTDAFRWLRACPPVQQDDFNDDLRRLATRPELTAIACVIDRPGHNARYQPVYGDGRWRLCKTAFSIVVERAAKYARGRGCRLRVNVERSDKSVDARLKRYYDDLRSAGPPFSVDRSSKYSPLAAEEFLETLYEFRVKNKSSPLIQMADLCLWPVCIGGYDAQNRAYRALRDAGSLIDSKLPTTEVDACGIKYSCFGPQMLAATENPKPG